MGESGEVFPKQGWKRLKKKGLDIMRVAVISRAEYVHAGKWQIIICQFKFACCMSLTLQKS